MEAILPVLNVLLPVLYAGLVVIYGRLLLGEAPDFRRVARVALPAVVGVHFVYILGEGLALGRHPMANKFELFSFVSMAMAAAYLWVERRRDNVATGVFPLALCLLLQVCASLGRASAVTTPERLRNPLFAWHTGSAGFALAAFSVGAIYGILFLVTYRALKKGRFSPFTLRLPPLDTLAHMSVTAAEVGLVALTIAVGLGGVWMSREPNATYADPKIIATLVALALYATAVGGRLFGRWGGWRVVALSLAGYCTLVGSLMTVGRLFPSFHRFP
jgi:HemX protein